jgi:hypothetical protein
VVYEVKFTPTPYLFGENRAFARFIFELSITVVDSVSSPPFDKITASTIAIIFDDFYRQMGEGITLYICDSSDGKQMIRHRKFSQWFDKFHEKEYIKLSAILVDTQHRNTPISIIMKTSNPYKKEISDAFSKVLEEYNKS